MTRLNDSHISWVCPACGQQIDSIADADVSSDHIVGWDETASPARETPIHLHDGGVWCIPVFAPLPTPIESTETREDMERHAEVVLCEDDGDVRLARPDDLGDYGCGLGSKRWALSRWPLGQNEWGLRSKPSVCCREGDTEADAVLYVVEGKKP